MSHNMRANPRNTLGFHVIGKRATKIEPVMMFPLDNIGLEDVWRAKAVAIEKIGKLIRERHSASIAVFRAERRCRSDLLSSLEGRTTRVSRRHYPDFVNEIR